MIMTSPYTSMKLGEHYDFSRFFLGEPRDSIFPPKISVSNKIQRNRLKDFTLTNTTKTSLVGTYA